MKYKLLKDFMDHKKGDILVRCSKPDYGMARDGEFFHKEPCVNLSVDGDYPFTTIPQSALQALERAPHLFTQQRK